MKKVFSSAEDVIHVFAQRTQSEGRSSNVFFHGDKIYSYGHHYLLGEFLDDNTILINDNYYTKTTAKHVGHLRWGSRQYKQFFTTETDIQLVYQRMLELKDLLAKARKPEKYINEILRLWGKFSEFLTYKKSSVIKGDVRYKEIKKLVTLVQKDAKGLQEKLAEAKKKEEQAKKKQQAALLKEKLLKFNTYEINSFRVCDEDFLRISQDGERVETSQGVKIDINDARNLYRLIKAGVDVKGERIGSYRVTSLNGHLVVGCHRINTKNMHEVGAKILK